MKKLGSTRRPAKANTYWTGSRPISLDNGRVYMLFLGESNTSKTSPMPSDIGWLPIQYCISYMPMILIGLFIKPSNITTYSTVFHIGNCGTMSVQ